MPPLLPQLTFAEAARDAGLVTAPPGNAGASANADERLAELKHVAAPQPDSLHGAAVHPRAVARPEVADDADAAAQRDLGVAARDRVVGEHEIATRAAADPRAAFERPLDAIDDQRARRLPPVPPAREIPDGVLGVAGQREGDPRLERRGADVACGVGVAKLRERSHAAHRLTLVARGKSCQRSSHVVGIVANPASGRDIRRLVAGASVFGTPEKAGMVYRVLVGLAAAGVDRAVMMPAADGLGWTLERLMKAHGKPLALEILDMPLTGTADDTTTAVHAMTVRGVKAIVVLGGDGTHRVVAKACGDTPIVALSTGTNNAFPEMREATIAGLAAGLATPDHVVREPALKVGDDLALVDVAVSTQPFIGAKALWRTDNITELFVTKPNPAAVGLSAIAGQLATGPVHLTLGPGKRVLAAIAPGLVVPVDVARCEPLNGPVTIHAAGCLALDGEREIERPGIATVTLTDGPNRIDIDAVMRTTRLHPREE